MGQHKSPVALAGRSRRRLLGAGALVVSAVLVVPLLVATMGEAASPVATPKTLARKAQVVGSHVLVSSRIHSVARGQLLVLFVGSDADASHAQSFSVKGCGLTWRLAVRANRSGGTSEIWTTRAPRALTNCAATATRAYGSFQGIATLAAFSGASVGRGFAASGKGAASVLVKSRKNSVVWGVGNDWDGAVKRSLLPRQGMISQLLSPAGDTMWVQRTGVATTSTTLRFGARLPTGHQFNIAALELVRGGTASYLPKPVIATRQTAAPKTPTTPSTAPPTTPTPTPTTPASGRPSAANTGVPSGTTLKASGALTVTTAGAVIDALDISGGVVIRAANVTIKRSRIHGSGDYGVQVLSGSVTIEDSEIYGFSNGIAFDNWKAYRVDIHGATDDGVKLGSNVLLQDSYIHDFTPSAGAHADGGQLQAGEVNVVVRHNYINPGSNTNSALFVAPDLGPSSRGPVTIDANTLGGGNYTLFCVDGNNGQYFVSNISITSNRFVKNAAFGPARVNVPVTWTGNVWDATGAAVTP